MRVAIVVVALAPSLLARADASLPGNPTAPVAECGSFRRAQLKRALVDHCEHEPSADARACHLVHRALRCETDVGREVIDREDGELELSVSDGCGGTWNVEFARAGRAWKVTRFNYDFGSCDP